MASVHFKCSPMTCTKDCRTEDAPLEKVKAVAECPVGLERNGGQATDLVLELTAELAPNELRVPKATGSHVAQQEGA